MSSDYEWLLSHGAFYKLNVCGLCEGRLHATNSHHRGVVISWVLLNLDNPSLSIWVTPSGALCWARMSDVDSQSIFTSDPLYVQYPGYDPEVATTSDLELVVPNDYDPILYGTPPSEDGGPFSQDLPDVLLEEIKWDSYSGGFDATFWAVELGWLDMESPPGEDAPIW